MPVELQRRVRRQCKDCCAYCRTAESLTATTFEFEHILPLSAGGETVLENLCLACPSCNRFKGNRRGAVDPGTQQWVELFHPQRQRWEEHFAWSEGSMELLGLTPVGRATIEGLKMNREALVRVRGLWVKLGEHPPD